MEASGTMLTLAAVADNKTKYSNLDCKRAEYAAKLQETIIFPSDKDVLTMINNKVIQNCGTSRQDMKRARDVFGKNHHILQGKTVRTQVQHICKDEITLVPKSILDRYIDIALSFDIFKVNDIAFLGSIARHLKFRTAKVISNMRKSTLLEGILAVT